MELSRVSFFDVRTLPAQAEFKFKPGPKTAAESFGEFSQAAARSAPVVLVSPSFENTVSKKSDEIRSFYLNGVLTSEVAATEGSKLLADALGRDVTLVYNDTGVRKEAGFISKLWGGTKDFYNATCGKLSFGSNKSCEPAVNVLAAEISKAYSDENISTIDLHAHSQGAIILRNSLELFRKEIGASDDRVWDEVLEKRFQISIYAAAEHRFPEKISSEYAHSNDVLRGAEKKLEKASGFGAALARFIYGETEDADVVKIPHPGSPLEAHYFSEYVNSIPRFFIEKYRAEGAAALGDAFVASVTKGEYSLEVYQEIVSLLGEASADTREEFFRVVGELGLSLD